MTRANPAIVPNGHNEPRQPLSPTQRWGTCCPFDPECEHSFMDEYELSRWMRSPITDAQAADIAGAAWDCLTCEDIGWITVPEHSQRCDGYRCDPELCPVPTQAPCPDCEQPESSVTTATEETPF